MFLKRIVNKNKRGDDRTYYAVAKSVRVSGKPRHQILHYLGALSDDEALTFSNILARQKNPNLVTADASRLMARRHYKFLDLWAMHWIYEFFGLHQLFEWVRYAELIVLKRRYVLSEQHSSRAASPSERLNSMTPSTASQQTYPAIRSPTRKPSLLIAGGNE